MPSGHYTRRSPSDRFNDKIELQENGCWLWTAYTDKDGYAMLCVDGRQCRAHRWSYERFIAPIPEGLHIDHLCRNTGCVNPTHLEPVSSRENTMRGVGITANHAKKTHCLRGHPLSGDNLYTPPSGERSCRICRRENDRKHYHLRKKRLND